MKSITQLIIDKKEGKNLSPDELSFFMNEYLKGRVPDYQMSSFLMAVCFSGLSNVETNLLTKIIINSGKSLNLKKLKRPVVDKHSSGGVGDKISLLLAPILACFNLTIPMISGRGLGHTGGTLDKLESLGMRTSYSLKDMEIFLKKNKMGIFAQTADICPLDKALYALRDTTGTVDNISLIASSIMSKKIAEGLTHLLLDIKWGSGAFMKKYTDALKLAKYLKQIGEAHGIEVLAMITDMNEPLGSYVGNFLEMKEAYEILDGKEKIVNGVDLYKNVRDLTIIQAVKLLTMSGITDSEKVATDLILAQIADKKALNSFKAMVINQGGSIEALKDTQPHKGLGKAIKGGYLTHVDAEKIGFLAIELGAGRKNKGDIIDPMAGIEILVKKGMKVKKNDVIFKVYGKKANKDIIHALEQCFSFGKDVKKEKLIKKILI